MGLSFTTIIMKRADKMNPEKAEEMMKQEDEESRTKREEVKRRKTKKARKTKHAHAEESGKQKWRRVEAKESKEGNFG